MADGEERTHCDPEKLPKQHKVQSTILYKTLFRMDHKDEPKGDAEEENDSIDVGNSVPGRDESSTVLAPVAGIRHQPGCARKATGQSIPATTACSYGSWRRWCKGSRRLPNVDQ